MMAGEETSVWRREGGALVHELVREGHLKTLEARPSVKSERCGHLAEGLWAKRAAGEDPEAGAH